MKRLTAKTITICAFFLAFLGVIGTAHAGNYIGELKWELTVEGNEKGENTEDIKATLTTGVTHMGDKYYLVQGLIEPSPDDIDGIIVMDGSAILIDNKIIMNLQMTQQHTNQYRDAYSWHFEIDISSWNGTWWSLGGWFGTLSKDSGYDDYNYGTIKMINK